MKILGNDGAGKGLEIGGGQAIVINSKTGDLVLSLYCLPSSWEDAMQTGTELGIKTWETEDAAEGLTSFIEKRAPVWKNK